MCKRCCGDFEFPNWDSEIRNLKKKLLLLHITKMSCNPKSQSTTNTSDNSFWFVVTAGHRLAIYECVFMTNTLCWALTPPVLLHIEGAILQYPATWTLTSTSENIIVPASVYTHTYTHIYSTCWTDGCHKLLYLLAS